MNFRRAQSKPIIPLAIVCLFAFIVAPSVNAQINNDIFSLTPKRYYSFGKKKPQYIDSMVQRMDSANIKQFDSVMNEYFIAKENEDFEESEVNMLPGRRNPHWGFLHYNKDNEYLQRINPGETFFGNQLWAFNTFALGHSDDFQESISLSLGGLVKYDFGGYESKLRFSPIMQIKLQTKKGTLIAGNLISQTQHNMPEPMINYDLAFKRPVEYGTQVFKKTKHWDTEAWLDWRQMLDTQTFRQEIISFGTRLEYQLFESHKHALNAKMQGYLMLLHRGGEGFRYFLPLMNRGTYSAGFTVFSDRKEAKFCNIPKFTLNAWAFYQKDFSPKLSQPMREGTAMMVNVGIRLNRSQQLIFTGYQANKFTTPLGAPFYQCVNETNPIYFNPVRKIVAARFIQRFHLVSQRFQLESRLEPIYDLDDRYLLYSLGLYLKYSM
jgi:hypothetical protein